MERCTQCNRGQTKGIILDRPTPSNKKTSKEITTRYKIGSHNMVYASRLAGLVRVGSNMDWVDASHFAMVRIRMA